MLTPITQTNNPLSQSVELYISQLTGQGNQIILKNRSLPYQKPEFLSGRQNMNKAVYPGNPVATIQILGSEELPTTFTGVWKDRFVEADIYYGSNKTSVTPSLNGSIGNAKLIVEFFNTLRLQGQKIGMSWSDFYEEGILKEAHFTWLRPQDVEYTLEFEWSKQDVQQPAVAGASLTTLQTIVNDIAGIQAQIASFSDELLSIQGYLSSLTIALETSIGGILGSIAYATSNLLSLGTQAFNLATAPVQVYVQAMTLLTGLVNQSSDLIKQLNNTESQIESPSRWQQTRDYLNFTTALSNLKNQALLMVGKSSDYSDSLNKTYVQNNDYITEYTAKDGDNLRMVSQKFYGDASYWTYLADINFLQNSQLSAGTVLLIPKVPGTTIINYPPPLNSIVVPATVTP